MRYSKEVDTKKKEIKKKYVFIVLILVYFVLADYIAIIRLKYLHNQDFLNISVSATMSRLLA